MYYLCIDFVILSKNRIDLVLAYHVDFAVDYHQHFRAGYPISRNGSDFPLILVYGFSWPAQLKVKHQTYLTKLQKMPQMN